jgi:hypothetical protein
MRRLVTAAWLAMALTCAPDFSLAQGPSRASPRAQSQRSPDVRVWVNTRSGAYHCPGTRWYGTTKSGTYMTQQEAQGRGYRPAYGKVCQSGLSATTPAVPSPPQGAASAQTQHTGNPDGKGMGEDRLGCVSLSGYAVVREHKAGQIYDAGAGSGCELSSSVWEGLPVVLRLHSYAR